MERVANIIKGRKTEMTASDVRQQYDANITQFLHKVNGPSPGWWNGDMLGKLFAWGESICVERNNLQAQLSGIDRRHIAEKSRLQGQISAAEERIKTDRKQAQSRLSELDEKNRAEQHRLRSQLVEATDRIRRLEAEISSAQQRIALAETKNDSLKTQYLGELDNLKNRHTTVVKKEKDIHGQEVKKLVGQLLVNQDDNMGWTDDKLKFKFQQLQALISSLVSPHNKAYRIPSQANVDSDLDPTGFLMHTPKAKAHFLLQHHLWAIIYEQFFSTPFGFGVIGDGDAQQKLLDIYISWVELLGKTSSNDSSSDQVFAFFRQSKAANNWRSSGFQCINEASNQTDAPSTSITALIAENVSRTIVRMSSVLSKVSSLSGNSNDDEVESLQQIAVHARDLALQFGLHSAQLQLYVPKHGDAIQIGEDVHHCEDGDCDRGAKHFVDFVTLPGLQKIGDGRSDMTTRRTLVPCEIHPSR